MSWLRKPGRPGIAEYTPRTVPAPPPEPAQPATTGLPAWCHIRVPHPQHHHSAAGDCPGTLGEPLPHPAVQALRRHIQRSDVGTGLADALNAERAGPTAEQTIRWWALTAARILVPGRGDLDQQAAAILEVAGRFETWIRDGSTVHEGAGDD